MGSVQSLSSETIDLGSFLKEYRRFMLPCYQREYVWSVNLNFPRKGEASCLAEDMYDYWTSQGAPMRPDRFDLNTITYYREIEADGEEVRWVIDGQQRITTTFIMAAAALRLTLEFAPGATMLSILRELVTIPLDGGERIVPRLRVDNRKKDVQDVVLAMSLGKASLTGIRVRTRCASNMAQVYEGLTMWLRRKFFEGAQAVVEEKDRRKGKGPKIMQGSKAAETGCRAMYEFLSYALRQSELVAIRTPDALRGICYYESANNRGTGMSPIDYTKFLFFRNLPLEWQARVDDVWSEMQAVLIETMQIEGEARMLRESERFMSYFVMVQKGLHRSKEGGRNTFRSAIADMLFKDNRPIPGEAVLSLTELLHSVAVYYADINVYRLPGSGFADPDLLAVNRINPAFVVHHIALMAARGLPPDLLKRISGALADWAFVMQMTNTHRATTEAHVMRIADILRGWQKTEGDEDAVKAEAAKRVAACEEFLNERKRLHERKLVETLLRRERTAPTTNMRGMLAYAFCKVEAYLETEMGRNGSWPRIYGYRDGKLSADACRIDFVIPPPPPGSKDHEHAEQAFCLGNYVLVKGPHEAGLTNVPFGQKRRHYAGSEMILTSMLVDDGSGDAERTPREAKVLQDLRAMGLGPYETWDEDAIARRHEALGRLICKVFDVDLDSLPEVSVLNDTVEEDIGEAVSEDDLAA